MSKGRRVDNVFVELLLWKSVKYEEVYWHAYGSISRLGRLLQALL